MALDLSTVKPGIFQLTQEIQNPHRDRRVRWDWCRLASFPKGTRFQITLVREERWTIKHEGQEIELAPKRDDLYLHPEGTRYYDEGLKIGFRATADRSIKLDKGKYADIVTALFNHLEPIEITDFDTLHSLYERPLREYDGYRTVLKLLVQQGKVSLADVEAGMKLVESFEIFDVIGEPE